MAIPVLDPVDVKRHMVTLHHIITVYNEIIEFMDCVIRALAK